MRSKAIPILGILLASLVFQGESCLLEQKEIAAIIGSSIPAEFVTTGYTQGTDMKSDLVDADSLILNAIDEIEIDDIDSIRVTGACYEVTAYSGTPRQRVGSISVNGTPLLTFDATTDVDAMGCSGDGSLTFNSAGIDAVNTAVNNFLAAVKAGQSPSLQFNYVANWTSTPPPSQSDQDNFTWHVDLKLQVYYSPEIDVPNI